MRDFDLHNHEFVLDDNKFKAGEKKKSSVVMIQLWQLVELYCCHAEHLKGDKLL